MEMDAKNMQRFVTEITPSSDKNVRQLSRLEAYHDRLGDRVRDTKISFASSGGTASKGAKTARITLPNKWIRDMGITPDDREVTIRYEDGKIIIEKR